ncbi:hypothetical protein SAMN05444583_1481, partial [Rhodococcus maanshanensis]
VNENSRNLSYVVPVGADGTATMNWTPENAGKATVDATFSGRDGVTGSTTTQQLTITAATTTTPKPTTPGTPPAADAKMGGDRYQSTDAWRDGGWCSLGFNGTDGAGHAVNITAGHCDTNPLAVGTPDATGAYEVVDNARGERFGTFVKAVLGSLDHGLIKIDDNFAKRFENNYVRVPGKAPVPITGVGSPLLGQPVCLSGQRTGYHCGEVNSLDASVSRLEEDSRGKFTVRICGLQGDSGSPVITGTMALGIATQSNKKSQEDCDLFESLEDLSDYDRPTVEAVPIKSILADNPGLKVRTN